MIQTLNYFFIFLVFDEFVLYQSLGPHSSPRTLIPRVAELSSIRKEQLGNILKLCQSPSDYIFIKTTIWPSPSSSTRTCLFVKKMWALGQTIAFFFCRWRQSTDVSFPCKQNAELIQLFFCLTISVAFFSKCRRMLLYNNRGQRLEDGSLYASCPASLGEAWGEDLYSDGSCKGHQIIVAWAAQLLTLAAGKLYSICTQLDAIAQITHARPVL